jgi:hypothetical protein
MHRFMSMLYPLALVCLQASLTHGQEVRYYEENGVTYQVSERTVQRPVVQTEWQQREQTVYRQQPRTELRDTLRTYLTPVTQHEWVTRMHGRWNPFMTPYFSHHLVPITRWERRAEVVPVPVVENEWVSETRTVSVPVTTQRIAEEKIVSKVAVGRAPATSSHVVRRPQSLGTPIGGVALEGDPPRQGWRPSGTTLR